MRRVVATLLLLTLPIAAYAQEPTEALSGCLADQTSGKDRKDLARWMFFAIGAHPENKPFLAAGAAQGADEANKTAAALLMRLMTDSCVVQTRAAIKQGGAQAIRVAFEAFGKLAMQELMSSPDVTAAIGALDKHLDQQKLLTALGGK